MTVPSGEIMKCAVIALQLGYGPAPKGSTSSSAKHGCKSSQLRETTAQGSGVLQQLQAAWGVTRRRGGQTCRVEENPKEQAELQRDSMVMHTEAITNWSRKLPKQEA